VVVRTGRAALRTGRAAVDGVTAGSARWATVAGEAELAGAVGAEAATGDAVAAGAAAVPGTSVTAGVVCTTLRPGAVRAATIASKPAPATAETVTARVMLVNRRTAWSRAETRWFIGVQLRSSC
jgi:hypothetical protein